MTAPPAEDGPSRSPNRSTFRATVQTWLAGHNTLTLATADETGSPSAAAVFYAHDESLRIYFLTEERTQHGRNMLARSEVAASIQADGQDWRSITGLQLRGRATPVSVRELSHAIGVFGRKFGFVAGLTAGREGPAVLSGPVARARLWVLRPIWIRLIDNRVAFGHKEELWLDEAT